MGVFVKISYIAIDTFWNVCNAMDLVVANAEYLYCLICGTPFVRWVLLLLYL
jgi:hypothetical protein